MQGETNYKWAREAAKWGADFMAKSTEDDRVLLHIGDIGKDHGYAGRGEEYPQMDRNILFCNSGVPPAWLLGAACSALPTVQHVHGHRLAGLGCRRRRRAVC